MIGAIIQARMGSTRLPGKVLMPLAGIPAISHVIERTKRIAGIEKICLATTKKDEDDPLVEVALSHSISVYRGSELDVLDRYYNAAELCEFDTIVRITGDCPLLDPWIGRQVVAHFAYAVFDYVSNVHPPSWPDGLDVEVFSYEALCKAWAHAKGPEREHVTPYIWKRPYKFRVGNVYGPHLQEHRWTLDTPEDYAFLSTIFQHFGPGVTTGDVLSSLFKRTLPRAIRL